MIFHYETKDGIVLGLLPNGYNREWCQHVHENKLDIWMMNCITDAMKRV